MKILMACGRTVSEKKVFAHSVVCKVCSHIKWSVASVKVVRATRERKS
jgi:hypothetical protein